MVLDQSTLSGDNGGYLRNTLSYPYRLNHFSITTSYRVDIGQVKTTWQLQRMARGVYGLSSGLNIQYQQALQLDLEVAKGELLYHQTNSNKTKDPTQLLVKFSYLFLIYIHSKQMEITL